MKKLKNTNKGITLIALIITIIVMLILVSVTITMAINGGLFDYAGKAVSEMQNAINAEQQLADGKIKIGDKWYASIDDYINNNPITTGIEVNPAEITLKKNEEGAEGTEVLTGTITASVFGMESEPEITWEKSSDAITLSSTTGKSITVGVAETQTEDLEATVTAKCTYEGKEYTQACKVTLEMIKKPVEIERGDFVKYDVEYTDVYYDTYEYSSTNGWRLLHYTDNGDGTISNVELISTGVPAQLYYYNTSYSATGNNKWWITDKTTEFKTALQKYYGDGTSSYTFYSDTGSNVYATAGMYYNFENIPFYTESNYNAITTSSEKYNLGWYRSIKKNGTEVTENINGSIFLTSNDYSVRMLTLPEINDDRSDVEGMTITSKTIISSTHEPAAGLYILKNIKNISELSSNTYSDGCYWLDSPNVRKSYSVHNVFYDGNVTDGGSIAGVRPVVSLKSGVNYTVEADKDETTNLTYLKLIPAA